MLPPRIRPPPQSQALKSAGCVEIHEEQASGGDRARPVLARVLEVIERLEAKDAFFRSIQDPIDPAALRKVRLARQDGYMERLNETAQDWVPHLRRLRPHLAWEDVVRIINGPLPHDRRWTHSRLLRAVKAYVRDGFLPAIVAGIKGADPDTTLQVICTRLENLRERTPWGQKGWQPSSAKMLLERAKRLGLL